MNTLTLSGIIKRTHSSRREVDFSAILVVYKSKEGYWKGFVHPYGVTSQAKSKARALTLLKELVEAYRKELKKYGFPSHLVYQTFVDVEDREMFSVVVKDAVDQKGIIDKEDYHAETYTVRP
ncbi:MAG: hypothetical protein AAB767_02030 [Patescibacteria group bacterium]